MSLFPLPLKTRYPATGSADLDSWGLASDGFEYSIKTITKTPNAPPAEWFCNRLADACGIATPQINKIELDDGSLAFGSRSEGGVASNPIAIDILSGKVAAHELSDRFSAIYAFDLFVHNVDRHWGNYLFLDARGAYSVKAVDFSRAWFFHGWPIPNLPMVGQQTVKYYRDLTKQHPFLMASATKVLDVIEKIPVTHIQTILNEIPTAWLSKDLRKAVVKWWSIGGGMATRATDIRGGLQNGSYL